MGKASELDDYFARHSLTPEQMEARRPATPELRLRSDVRAVDINDSTLLCDAVEPLGHEDISGVALRDSNGTVTAVVVPTARYLELVATSIEHDPRREATTDGHIMPSEQAFAELHVQQVDPQASWHRVT